jgi:hypothetical protein
LFFFFKNIKRCDYEISKCNNEEEKSGNDNNDTNDDLFSTEQIDNTICDKQINNDNFEENNSETEDYNERSDIDEKDNKEVNDSFVEANSIFFFINNLPDFSLEKSLTKIVFFFFFCFVL